MSDYILITDSNADLSPKMVEELGLHIIPMPFTINDTEYFDTPEHTGMGIKEFYNAQRNGTMSTTAALNPSDVYEFLKPFLSAGKDVLYLVFSSGLSTTYRNACLAVQDLQEEFPDRKIIAVDSLAASMGQGLLAYHMVMKQREGLTIEELEQWLVNNRNNLCHWFTVNDLFHLKRGGRVSAAAAVLGSALSIKPVLHVDNEGHLINVSKVRGRRQSLDALVKKIEETAINPKEQTIFISHGDCVEDAEYVAEKIKEKVGVKQAYINYIGPIIGTHSGAGTVALFFMGTEK